MNRHSQEGCAMLTLVQKTLVQESFATIAPIADDAAALFYRRLFEIDPSLKKFSRRHG
jgi:nitric oxide dioxygenase